ncbi:MAG: DUF134 domain-containing protein [Patescibacteria group bacterium]
MPRPRLRRHTCIDPGALYFKPRGIPLKQLQVISITREELEAFWLVDVKGYEQIEAARHMKTSQSTIQRILSSARKKTAQALSEGLAIAIEK